MSRKTHEEPTMEYPERLRFDQVGGSHRKIEAMMDKMIDLNAGFEDELVTYLARAMYREERLRDTDAFKALLFIIEENFEVGKPHE